jgi:hypothetical protein
LEDLTTSGWYPDIWPRWKSPDVFVDNDGDRETNSIGSFRYYLKVDKGDEPQKGKSDNRLFGVIENLGSTSALNVLISFSYAPYGFVTGTLYKHVHFKDIADVTIDPGPAGTTDARKEVEVGWDLSDPTENNGGLWPAPVGYFNHFCVTVSIDYAGDVNLGNNSTQHNFANVVSSSLFTPIPLAIANSEDKAKEYAIVASNLPKMWKLRFGGLDQDYTGDEQICTFRLGPHEEKFLTLTILPAKEKERRKEGIEVSIMEDGKEIGGVTFNANQRDRKDTIITTHVPKFILPQSKPVWFPRNEVVTVYPKHLRFPELTSRQRDSWNMDTGYTINVQDGAK